MLCEPPTGGGTPVSRGADAAESVEEAYAKHVETAIQIHAHMWANIGPFSESRRDLRGFVRCFETGEVGERHSDAVSDAVPKSRFSMPSSDGQSRRFAFAKRR